MDTPVAKAEVTFGLVGEQPPLIKPGMYEFRFLDWQTWNMYGRVPKLVLRFRICTMGEYFDRITLPRYYNCKNLIGKAGRFGRFSVGHKSEFIREYADLFRLPSRLDRIAMTPFETAIIVGRVRTVTHGARQRAIPEALQYSVISTLERAKFG
jgi:hypothetical protein